MLIINRKRDGNLGLLNKIFSINDPLQIYNRL